MTTIETNFTDADDAVKWAEEQGRTVYMASTRNGKVTLTCSEPRE